MKAAAAQQAYDAPRTIAEAFRGMASPPEAARPSPDMVGPMAQMAPDQAVARFLPDALQGIAALDTGDIGSVFRALVAHTPGTSNEAVPRAFAGAGGTQNGRASRRGRGCPYESTPVVAGLFKKKTNRN